MLNLLTQVLLMPFPWAVRRFALRRLLKFELHNDAFIGLSLIMADRVVLKEGARVGNLTVIKGLDLVELNVHARLGNLNWVTGFPNGTTSPHFAEQAERVVQLRIGDHSAITNRHLIDCTGGVTIGRFSTVAGFRSQILTHSIDIQSARQRAKAVRVGDYCFVGTACTLLPGASLPSYSVLGANSLLNKAYETTHTLYAGNPARSITTLAPGAKYFSRTRGFIV